MVEFIKTSYTGKEKETGSIFDTTDEKIAKEAGIYNQDAKYEPRIFIVGDNQIIKGLDEKLQEMKVGEQKTIEVSPENAYGKRDSNLVRLVPLKVFKDNDVNPVPGMVVQLDRGIRGKVRFVSGGRVSIDLNHELAGKTLIFDIKIEEKITEEDKIIKALFGMVFPGIDSEKAKITKIEDGFEIVLPKEVLSLNDLQIRKLAIIKDTKKYLNAKKVKITEEY